MATLTFNAEKVAMLMQHAIVAPRHIRKYGQSDDPAPALLFVTEGSYLMSNGEPCSQGLTNMIVYAEGYDPPNGLPGVAKELVCASELVRAAESRGRVDHDPSLSAWASSVERLLPAPADSTSPRLLKCGS